MQIKKTMILKKNFIKTSEGVAGLEWWRKIEEANWCEINGPGTFDQAYKDNYPACIMERCQSLC